MRCFCCGKELTEETDMSLVIVSNGELMIKVLKDFKEKVKIYICDNHKIPKCLLSFRGSTINLD
jgi:DNA-directed RNA polymerase subunit N (RpoN/RPB10)